MPKIPTISTSCIVCGNDVQTPADNVYVDVSAPDEFGVVFTTVILPVAECQHCAENGLPLSYDINLKTGERI